MFPFVGYTQTANQYSYGTLNSSGEFEPYAEILFYDNGEFRYRLNNRHWFDPLYNYGQYEINSDTILLRHYSEIKFDHHFETTKTPRTDSSWKWTFKVYSYENPEKLIDSIDLRVYFIELKDLRIEVNKQVHTGSFELFSVKVPEWEECWPFVVTIDYQWLNVSGIFTDGIIQDTACMVYKTRPSSIVDLGFCHAEISEILIGGQVEPLLTDYNYHTKMTLVTDLTDRSFYNYLGLHRIPLFGMEVQCVINDSTKSIIKLN